MVPADAGLEAFEPERKVCLADGTQDQIAADARQQRILIAEALVMLAQLLTMFGAVATDQNHVPIPRDSEAVVFHDGPPTVVNIFAAYGQPPSIQPERPDLV